LLPTELHFLTPVCTKSFVGWLFGPDPIGGAYSHPKTLSGFNGRLRGLEGEGKGRDDRGRRELSFAIGRKRKLDTSAWCDDGYINRRHTYNSSGRSAATATRR